MLQKRRRRRRPEKRISEWPDETVELTARGAFVFELARNISEKTQIPLSDILDIIVQSLENEGGDRAHGEGGR